MTDPFIGAEALATGTLNRHQLRTRHRAIFPGVYLANDLPATLSRRITGAWLWSGRRGVVAGLAAASMLGSRWIDDDVPIQLLHANPRPPPGIVTHRALLLDGERRLHAGIACTSAARTAFDVGRGGTGTATVARLDALLRATGLGVADVLAVAARHPNTAGLRRLESALALVDAGAESPRETALRLLLVRGGFPAPRTQIPVRDTDGQVFAYLDMGWEEWMVAVEYDGDQHRTDRWQYVKDIKRIERLERMGWIVIRVVAEDRPHDVLRRVRDAVDSRRLAVS